MTKAEALTEAKKRWGTSAQVKSGRVGVVGFYPHTMLYRVGVPAAYGHTFRFKELGQGDSWESAIADADGREPGRRDG